MEKNNGGKIVAVFALVVAVVALSIGFAAYAATLTIDGNATIKASDQFSANVVYDQASGYAPNCFATGDNTKASIITSGYSTGSITNSGHSWTGISVPLVWENDAYTSVTCEAYVKNESAYIAYLTNLYTESGRGCESVASSGNDVATNTTTICGATSITVSVGNESINIGTTNTSLANPTGTIAAKSGDTVSRVPVTVVISNSSTVPADGDIRVTLPTITHIYSTTR